MEARTDYLLLRYLKPDRVNQEKNKRAIYPSLIPGLHVRRIKSDQLNDFFLNLFESMVAFAFR
jgi:hypothetical protein